MNLKIGDKVIIISGKDKGKEGKVLKIIRENQRILIEGINIIKKHVKPNANNEQGGIVEQEASIHISNVMIIDPKTKKRTKIGHSIDKDNKKIRIAKKSGQKLD